MPFAEISIGHETLIYSNNTIQDAIKSLNISGLQIAVVISNDGILLGTITDGDIRRALLRGLELNSRIDIIMNQTPLVVTPEIEREMVLHLMRANKIHQIPVVDDQRRVVGLHVWNDLMTTISLANTMVIMAGGFGKRLRPYTPNCPKPMLPVSGKPMLEHIIERAKSEGFRNFIISIHYLGHMITEYFGDGSHWGVSISYTSEDTPLGTAGALSLIRPKFTLPFVVTNGDVLTDVHYGEMLGFHVNQNAQASMAVRVYEWQHPFGVVSTKGIKIIGFEEKPIYRTHVNAGIYVLNPEVLEHLQSGAVCDMPMLFERIRQANGVTIAYPMHELWLDVGSHEDLKLANCA